ncbi:MAG: NAD(P)H-dependent oxidoreductase [Lachnospiraceae bacterium]|nr:NAD(P)H-dependent oxidoreductase [Lachnospiraceae bacterium]
MALTVIRLDNVTTENGQRLKNLLAGLPHLQETPHEVFDGAEAFLEQMKTPEQFKGRRVLFCVALDDTGTNDDLMDVLRSIRRQKTAFDRSLLALIIDTAGDLYSKSSACGIALAINNAGGAILGGPLVEATGSLKNFKIRAMNYNMSLENAYAFAADRLVRRLLEEPLRGEASPDHSKLTEKLEKPEEIDAFPPHRRLLCLHTNHTESSNTFSLWQMVKAALPHYIEVAEISLENEVIHDCRGCSYDVCHSMGKRTECFFHDIVDTTIYPALEEADALIMLCANRNDALAANLTAFINRLTAIFRKRELFSDKKLFAIIVSGYSGSDIIEKQLIAALGMNKTFSIPPHFALAVTANAPGEIFEVEGIEELAGRYASHVAGMLW